MGMRRNATSLVGALVVTLFVAGACGGSGDDGVATPPRRPSSLPRQCRRSRRDTAPPSHLLHAAFAEFGELGDAPEGVESEIPEIALLYSIRLETVSVNDPSLSVTLPDPSLVVALH